MWPKAVLDSLSYGEQEQDWRDWMRSNPDDLIYVAELSAGEVVGYALARPGPTEILGYDSEQIALHVLGPYERQRPERSLVAAVAKALQSRGSESLMLWVLKENRARGFYERLGGHLLADQKISWAERLEVAYGWPGIEVLCGQRWG